MLAIAAAQLGYRTHIYAPDVDSPAAEVSAAVTRADYDDADALARFAATVDVATYDSRTSRWRHSISWRRWSRSTRPRVRSRSGRTAFSRRASSAIWACRPLPLRQVEDRAMLDQALAEIGTPSILKTRRFGYDGKGQGRLASAADADTAWAAIGGRPAILEQRVAFDREFSVLLCRGTDGADRHLGRADNVHHDGIPRDLDRARHRHRRRTGARGPRRLPSGSRRRSIMSARSPASSLRSASGPIFNEMAPRVPQ
jgi:5-(carboxyamino)imidazole ribonucleotide synthase